MIEILIAKVFNTRNAVHLAHWKTKSYAAHMALGELYDSLIEDIDAIVECYQGAFKVLTIPELPGLLPPKDIIKHLEEEAKWIEENCCEIAGKNGAVENLIQNLSGNYFKSIYKLKNLS